ncbi:hypothetical protein BJV78DRAFT_1222594 [Lactifluus subvellereus]|nr:hypothetical protein BJV78DRAFT_1222594 [Lactifluus subvellereus]
MAHEACGRGDGLTNSGASRETLLLSSGTNQCLNLVHGHIMLYSPFILFGNSKPNTVQHHVPRAVPAGASLNVHSLSCLTLRSTHSFFANSGSKVVETALKMARDITRKQNIITMQAAYHRRTFAGTAEPRHCSPHADTVTLECSEFAT